MDRRSKAMLADPFASLDTDVHMAPFRRELRKLEDGTLMAVRNREAKVEGYHLERLILAGRELSRRGIGPTEGKWDVEEAI